MKNALPITNQKYKTKLSHPYLVTPHLRKLLEVIKEASGVGILVGGCVRDHLLGHDAKDLDVEVYGVDIETLEAALSKHFLVYAVGRSFGIFKV